jgi:hypothetical protein
MNAAIQCNNVGVSLLGMGLIVESLDAFKGAAQILYPVSQSFHTIPTSEIDAAIQQMPPLPDTLKEEDDATTVQQVNAALSLAEHSVGTKKYPSTDDSFVCVDPLMLDPVEGEPTSCTMESAIIVMNMGLAYHLNGCEPGLSKALSLFDMAFAIAHPLINDLRSEKVAMASLNNAAHIHHSLGNYQYSAYYLDILTSYIYSLPETNDYMTMKARNYFMLNAMLLQQPTSARAA